MRVHQVVALHRQRHLLLLEVQQHALLLLNVPPQLPHLPHAKNWTIVLMLISTVSRLLDQACHTALHRKCSACSARNCYVRKSATCRLRIMTSRRHRVIIQPASCAMDSAATERQPWPATSRSTILARCTPHWPGPFPTCGPTLWPGATLPGTPAPFAAMRSRKAASAPAHPRLKRPCLCYLLDNGHEATSASVTSMLSVHE